MAGPPVGLELILHAHPDRDPWDATNYLGGVADVLQDKRRSSAMLDLSHLGDLRDVALYENDRQICEVHYQQRMTDTEHYSVRLWVLEAFAADFDEKRSRQAAEAMAVLDDLRTRVRTGGRKFTREEMNERRPPSS